MHAMHYVLVGLFLVGGCGGGGSDPTPETTPPVIQPIPEPTARTWAVQGKTADGGTFSGTFSYEKNAAPIAENVRGNQNVIYPLKAWDIQAHPTYQGIPIVGLPPVLFFSNTGFVDTSELCFNECIFDPNNFSRLVFDNGLQTLTLAFRLPMPHVALPTEAGDWGVLEPNASYLQSGNPSDDTFQYRMVVREAALTDS